MEQPRYAKHLLRKISTLIADLTVFASSHRTFHEEPGGRPRINKKTVSIDCDVQCR